MSHNLLLLSSKKTEVLKIRQFANLFKNVVLLLIYIYFLARAPHSWYLTIAPFIGIIILTTLIVNRSVLIKTQRPVYLETNIGIDFLKISSRIHHLKDIRKRIEEDVISDPTKIKLAQKLIPIHKEMKEQREALRNLADQEEFSLNFYKLEEVKIKEHSQGEELILIFKNEIVGGDLEVSLDYLLYLEDQLKKGEASELVFKVSEAFN